MSKNKLNSGSCNLRTGLHATLSKAALFQPSHIYQKGGCMQMQPYLDPRQHDPLVVILSL
jgi:hypothetical protein